MSQYDDPILDKIKDIIDAGETGIKTFFQGDPLMIAKSDLPCLVLSKDNTVIGDESNAEDYHRQIIILTLISDIRQQLDDEDIRIHAGSSKLYEIMEARDSEYKLEVTSVVDLLRKTTDLGNRANIDLTVPMNIDYGFTLGKRGPKALAWEANLSISIYFTQLRS